ncbi:MAG TPA: acetoacetate decarboxylase family protein [Solirubrobacteraceae bacterium]|nr:acetoacetate decarboxylase family protein [Solirubrobacteraceae bacterium]
MSIADCLRGESAGRLRRESGRHALVDGIPFRLPVASHESPALMAAFSIDGRAAAELLPGGEVHPLRVWGERALLVISVVDYRSTNIGRYIEFSVAIACTHGERPAPALTPALPLAQRLYGTGQYVIDLPVSSEVSVKGGKGIWGMPKHRANLDFVIAPRTVSSQYDLDGELCVRIEVDRPRFEALPLSMATSNYCAFRGMLMKSNISFRGRAGFNLPLTRSARLQIGEHPRVQMLKRLGISSRPLFCGYFPSTEGILDDHIDSWFLSFATPPSVVPEGMESVVGLGQSQEWLAPPQDPALDEPGAQVAEP